jgi:hypothetical protein
MKMYRFIRKRRIVLFPSVGYEAEEPEKLRSSVLELVPLASWNKNNVFSAERDGFFSVEKLSPAFEYEDFVFPRMRVQWAVSAGFHFEEAHGEVLGAQFFGDEPAYFGFGGAAFGVLGFYGVVVEYVHLFSPSSGVMLVLDVLR